MQMIGVKLSWLIGATLMLGSVASTTLAADSQGNYAISGAGSQSCERFLQSTDGGSDDLRTFLSWMQGYITAMNRLREDTFDVVPLVNPGEIAALALNVCRDNRDTRFEAAFSSLLEFLQPGRVTHQSPIVQVASGEDTLAIRQSVLVRAQERLDELGHYQGTSERLFDDDMQTALRSFQTEQGLNQTGLPDADTLLRLFYE